MQDLILERRVTARGADAAEAMAAIARLFADVFEQWNSDESPRVMPIAPNLHRRPIAPTYA